MTRILSGVGLFLLAMNARAELRWERDLTVIDTEPGAGTVLAHFPFQNAGTQPVTITSVKTSCGCTGTVLEKKTWLPGEHGDLQARYFAGERKGTYGVDISVRTDEAPEPKSLHLRTIVAEVAELKPTLAFWKPEEALTTKGLTLNLHDGVSVKSVSAATSDSRTAVEVKPGKAGRYEIAVTPSARGVKATLQVTVTLADDKTRVLKAFARS